MYSFSIKPGWVQLAATVGFFFFIKFFLSFIVLSSFYQIVIDAEFEHQESVEVFYSTNSHFQGKLSQHSSPFLRGKREVKSVNLYNQVARRIRIDLGGQPGKIKLYSLKLQSFFGKEIHFTPQQIYEKFIPNADIVEFTLNDDHVLITSQANDPYLSITENLFLKGIFFSIILPCIFTYLFFLLLSHFSAQQFPAFRDLSHKTSSLGVNIGSLDGIRGLAALMVLAAHTGIQQGSMGALGVWLFFSLSGFLLATPFAQHPEKAVSYSFMSTYLLRRLKRILPMYYTYITITMLFSNKNPDVFRHYLFLQGDGHLWTIPQEMLFYLILPFLMIAIYILGRGNRIFSIIVLLLAIFFANKYLTLKVVAMYGYGVMLPSDAGIFLSGVFFSFVYHWLYQNSFFQRLDRHTLHRLCSFSGLLLLSALILLSVHAIPEWHYYDGLNHRTFFGFLCGFFIFLVLLSRNSLLDTIMNFQPLRAVGLVGFSFYLLHPLFLSLYLNLSQYYAHYKAGVFSAFIVTGIATYFFSALTYTYIERPFLKKHQTASPLSQ